MLVNLVYSGVNVTGSVVPNGTSAAFTVSAAGNYTVCFIHEGATTYGCPDACCNTCTFYGQSPAGPACFDYMVIVNPCDVKTFMIQDYDVCDSGGTSYYIPQITGPF